MKQGWTVELVKEKLPQVPVLVPGKGRVMCQIGGRKLAFAGVWLPDGSSIEVSWETLVRVLNRGEKGVLLL